MEYILKVDTGDGAWGQIGPFSTLEMAEKALLNLCSNPSIKQAHLLVREKKAEQHE